jgi:hypothetical protein
MTSQQVRTLAVIGAGTTGTSIAICDRHLFEEAA